MKIPILVLKENMKEDPLKRCTLGAIERFLLGLENKLSKFKSLNPKGSELFLGRLKSPETEMEGRTHSDAQIDVKT